MQIKPRECLSDTLLDRMNFLSEITLDLPDAISFATGSPKEQLFDVRGSLAAIDRYITYRATMTGTPPNILLDELGQYNRTNGIVNDLLARHLAVDENIHVPQNAIMVTTGFQEAASILMMGLFEPTLDALLVTDPAYMGITGLARILNVPVMGIPVGDQGLEVQGVQRTLDNLRQQGRRARALYDVPDFNNPLGTSMPLDKRHALLEFAEANELIIIEDNPYGMFAYDGERLPTLKALDTKATVIYIGTFAKTIFPGLRIGFLVADQRVNGGEKYLAQELSKVKGFNTVNTSSLSQAIVGGILLGTNGSLVPIVESKLPIYRANRDRMIACLEQEFGTEPFRSLISWNRPAGGFFLTLSLPFDFDEQCFRTCAIEYRVLCCPISFFSLGSARSHQVRLSFSYVTPAQIEQGIRRLAQFVRDRLDGKEVYGGEQAQ